MIRLSHKNEPDFHQNWTNFVVFDEKSGPFSDIFSETRTILLVNGIRNEIMELVTS